MILERFFYGATGTLGKLFGSEGQPQLWAVERPWLANQSFVSCIPEGEYKLELFSGTHWKDVIEVTAVPGRYSILIHPANRPIELAGCIAPGMKGRILNNEPEVEGSRDACAIVRKWFDAGDQVLTVRSVYARLR